MRKELIDYCAGFDKFSVAEYEHTPMKPDLVLYNQKKVFAFFKYRKLEPKQLNGGKDEFSTDGTKDGYDLLNSLNETYEVYAEMFGRKKANGLINIFFDIRARFINFHYTWRTIIPDEQLRILFCCVVCPKKDSKSIEESLRTLYSQANLKETFENGGFINRLENYDFFAMDIATFYHICCIGGFNHLTGISNRLATKKGTIKYETFGKNDWNAQIDPKRNAYHPDNFK